MISEKQLTEVIEALETIRMYSKQLQEGIQVNETIESITVDKLQLYRTTMDDAELTEIQCRLAKDEDDLIKQNCWRKEQLQIELILTNEQLLELLATRYVTTYEEDMG